MQLQDFILNYTWVCIVFNYFPGAMYYTSFIVLTELTVKLMPLVSVGSRVESQKGVYSFTNIPPVILTHFLEGGLSS